MTPQVTILPAAELDLDDQAEYLAREVGLETALRFYDEAASTFEQLARMPGLGQKHKSARPSLTGLRVFRVQGFERRLIFYRPTAGGIEVVRVLHGARDLDKLLGDED